MAGGDGREQGGYAVLQGRGCVAVSGVAITAPSGRLGCGEGEQQEDGAMTYKLVCTRGPMKGRRWKVTPQGLKIGRDKS